jgi:hypothetical protein
MHIILVRVILSIQNSCIKYSTQNQYFAEMFTYSDNTIIWISIILLFQFICDFIYSAIIHICPMSVMDGITAPITAPSFDKGAGICAIVAVVDTRGVLRVRETTARGVYWQSSC